MKIKVCGIKEQNNLNAIAALDLAFIGLNFYPESKRYVTEALVLPSNSSSMLVGVFVNETKETILRKVDEYNLDFVQLHGDEHPSFCSEIAQHIKVIKAVPVREKADLDLVNIYEDITYYLLDTKSRNYGGSGRKFEWSILNYYPSNIPFFLAGGISENDAEKILNIELPQLIGCDLNSKFEISPGIKNIEKVKRFKNNLLLLTSITNPSK